MGHHDHGGVVVCELFHNIQHLTGDFRIQRACRLVEKHKIRIHCQRPCNGNSLLLAAGKHGRVNVRLCFQPNKPEKLHGMSLRLGFVLLLDLDGSVGDVLDAGHMREKVEVLKYHPRMSLKLYFAGGRLRKPVDTAQQGALSGAGGADDGNDFAFLHGEVYMIHRAKITEILNDVFHFEYVFHYQFSSFLSYLEKCFSSFPAITVRTKVISR